MGCCVGDREDAAQHLADSNAKGDVSQRLEGHAQRLLAHALAEGGSLPVAVARTCDQLVGCLADFVGRSGARALFDRSLAIAARAHPWLAGDPTQTDEAAWNGLRARLEAHEASASAASLALISTLVELFATFVGVGLTIRILHQQWPDVFPVDATEETP